MQPPRVFEGPRLQTEIGPVDLTAVFDSTLEVSNPDLLSGEVVPQNPENTLPLRQRVASALGANRFVDVLRAAKVDFRESNNKLRTVSSGLGVLAVEAIGATRAPAVIVPIVAIGVLQKTGSPVEVGVATAALIGGWSFTVGHVLNSGVNRYPKAVKTAAENFSTLVEHSCNSLPGLEAPPVKDRDSGRLSTARHLGNRALTHVRRGLTAFSIGIAPYIAVAGMKGQSKPERRKLSAALSLDSGAVVGLMCGGLAETIIKLGHSHPELARNIKDSVGSAKLWYGVAASLMIGEWFNNKRKNRKATRLNADSLSS